MRAKNVVTPFAVRTARPFAFTDLRSEQRTKDQGGKVDYVICSNDKPVIYLECKAQGYNPIYDAVEQLRQYFDGNSDDVHLAVISNGAQFVFFSDLDVPSARFEKFIQNE